MHGDEDHKEVASVNELSDEHAGHEQSVAGAEEHAHHHGEDLDDQDEVDPQAEEPRLVKNIMGDIGSGEPEITSMLIQYRNPAAIGMFPRLVNQQSAMQAASPALESARLFSLLGIGIDSLQVLA